MELKDFAEMVIGYLKENYPCTCHEAYRVREKNLGYRFKDPSCMGCEIEADYKEIRDMAARSTHTKEGANSAAADLSFHIKEVGPTFYIYDKEGSCSRIATTYEVMMWNLLQPKASPTGEKGE